MNHWNAEIFSFYSYEFIVFEILRPNFDILVDGIDTTVHEDPCFIDVKVDLFVWIGKQLL